MSSESDLLGKLLDVDPWVFDRDGDSSSCHFCDSQEQLYKEKVYLHFFDCPWVLAYLHMRDALPQGHAIYEPPEPRVCETCGIVTTYDHHSRVSFSDDTTQHWAHLRTEARSQVRRTIADSLPTFTLPRGGISFLPASHGVIKSVDGTVHIDVNDIQFSAPVDGKMWNLNAFTIKWEDLT